MSRSKGGFWNPERLMQLRDVLRGAAKRDSKGFYFGPIGLSEYVMKHGKAQGLDVDIAQAGNGLQILVFLGALEPGRRGSKLLGYKRRFYPRKARTITEDDLDRYREYRRQQNSRPWAR